MVEPWLGFYFDEDADAAEDPEPSIDPAVAAKLDLLAEAFDRRAYAKTVKLADELLFEPHVVELANAAPAATIDHGLVMIGEQRKRPERRARGRDALEQGHRHGAGERPAQRARPAGGFSQARAVSVARSFPFNLRVPPGRLFSVNACSSPPSTYLRFVLYTVEVPADTARAISSSGTCSSISRQVHTSNACGRVSAICSAVMRW